MRILTNFLRQTLENELKIVRNLTKVVQIENKNQKSIYTHGKMQTFGIHPCPSKNWDDRGHWGSREFFSSFD